MNSEKIKIAKTYKLDKNLVKTFKNLCESSDKSQASQIEMLMNNYINTYNILFEKNEEGQIDILSVGNLIDFLSKFPENLPIKITVADENYEIDSYKLNNGELSLYSTFANDEAISNDKKIKGMRNLLLDILSVINQ